MKANLVSEELHNFERNQEPLRSLGIGVKNRFYDLMPKSVFSQGNPFWQDWSRMKEILDKPTTNIQFYEPVKEIKSRTDVPMVSISLPDDPLNWFFFKSLILINDSHTPKRLRYRSIQPNKVTFIIVN
jgi:hypothetical protein